jgi:hypothetical protein
MGYHGTQRRGVKMNLTKERVETDLTDMLNDLLESGNQEGSFEVTSVDLKNMKFNVAFNIVVVEEDNYIGFQGY